MPQKMPKKLESCSVSGQVFYLCADAAHSSMELPRNKRLLSLISDQLGILGAQSLGLITASGLATGAVMALQFGNGLQRFGGTLYVPELVGLSVLREIGPVMIGLLLAGRVGSGITAELASMNVSEQVDAIRAMGDSPEGTLVLPRIIACLIAFPVLTLFGDFVSILSAMFMANATLSIGMQYYLSKSLATLTITDVWTGLVKSLVFGGFIASVACWKGLSTTGGTRGVGLSTTWIVVRSSVFILISDFFLSKLFILTVLKHG